MNMEDIGGRRAARAVGAAKGPYQRVRKKQGERWQEKKALKELGKTCNDNKNNTCQNTYLHMPRV